MNKRVDLLQHSCKILNVHKKKWFEQSLQLFSIKENWCRATRLLHAVGLPKAFKWSESHICLMFDKLACVLPIIWMIDSSTFVKCNHTFDHFNFPSMIVNHKDDRRCSERRCAEWERFLCKILMSPFENSCLCVMTKSTGVGKRKYDIIPLSLSGHDQSNQESPNFLSRIWTQNQTRDEIGKHLYSI